MKQQIFRAMGIAIAVVLVAACATPVATPTQLLATPTLPQLLAAATPTQLLATPTPIRGRWENGTITSKALANNLIGDPATRPFFVYLPPGYDTSGKRYPVVYVLHWFEGNASEAKLMAPELEGLIASHKAREMILVFLDASNKFGGSWYQSSPTIGDYETYITKELVAQIDATYRTLPNRDSRAVTGCSMGGYGAEHLAWKYPDVFGVAVAMSGMYFWQNFQGWEESARDDWTRDAKDFTDLALLTYDARMLMAYAAVVAPNPNKPPFYLDMPFKIVNGKGQIVTEVVHKTGTLDPLNDARRYLQQPVRLRGLMIYHGTHDAVDFARAFDKALTEMGVVHDYVEIQAGHCDYDRSPSLEYISTHLAP